MMGAGSRFDEDGDEDAPPPARKKPARHPSGETARILAPGEGNGTVAELFPNQCAVRLDGAGRPVLCRYQSAMLASPAKDRERSPVCVGDRVRVENGVVIGRCERRNTLVRSAPESRNPLLHALAANLDLLVVVAAARHPDFAPNIVDRFLVAASAQKIPSILCVNKTDLLEPHGKKLWRLYPSVGVAVVETSARDSRGVADLAALVLGKAAVFCGHSGVGKTSLLRRLLEDDAFGRVGEVNAASGKGRHTTTGAVLLPGPGDSTWIDTPGIMNFGLHGVSRKDLLSHFPELAEAAAACPPGCGHQEEPACALRGLPRYASYKEILGSL